MRVLDLCVLCGLGGVGAGALHFMKPVSAWTSFEGGVVYQLGMIRTLKHRTFGPVVKHRTFGCEFAA